MKNIHQSNIISSIQKFSESSTESNSKFNPFGGCLQKLAESNSELDNLLSGISNLIELYLKSFVYDPKPQSCQVCGSLFLSKTGTRNKPMKDINGKYSIRIQRYVCIKCSKTTSFDRLSKDDLTFQNSGITISLSKLAVMLYIGGCSLRYVSDIILATTGNSMNKDTIRSHILKIGEKIRSGFENDLDRKKAKQLAMDEQFVTIRSKDPNEQSAMIITVIDLENNKIVLMKTEKAKSLTELDVKFVLDKFDAPEVIVTDGAPQYKSGIRDFAPECHHQGCLQHICRNIRKKKPVKKAIKEKSEEIIIEEIKQLREKLKQTYKREILKELTELLSQNIIEKKEAWKEVKIANEIIEEKIILSGYSEDERRTRKKIHEIFLQRRLYVGVEAANYAKLKEKGLESNFKRMTTGIVEGYHRTLRSRERRMLSFRSFEFVKAVSIINAELFNFKRGHGINDTPFINFKVSNLEIGLKPVERQITIRGEKYKQQRTKSIQYPGTFGSLMKVKQSILVS